MNRSFFNPAMSVEVRKPDSPYLTEYESLRAWDVHNVKFTCSEGRENVWKAPGKRRERYCRPMQKIHQYVSEAILRSLSRRLDFLTSTVDFRRHAVDVPGDEFNDHLSIYQ